MLHDCYITDQTRGRAAAYDEIVLACEGPLQVAIERANEQQSEKSLSKLEEIITSVLSQASNTSVTRPSRFSQGRPLQGPIQGSLQGLLQAAITS